MAAYPSRPVFKPPKLVTEAEAKAYKTRDATKVYLGRSYPKWIDAKSVNYNQESNAVFSLHLLEIHRLFCRECNPLPHSERECTCLPRSTGRRSIGENWEEGLQSTTLIAAGLGQGIQRAGSNISNTESFVGYKARTVLAAIDFNKHANRQKEVAVDGQQRYYCKYSKMSKRFYPVPVVAKKKYDYINDIQQQIFEMRLGVEGHLSQYVPPAENDPCHLHTRLSMMNPPNIADLVEAHKSRFAKSTTSEESV
ncbi:uncharacterized protein [Ptychodera flava]|uniref:uncharacterized protein isoform X3 n=1 Tax=Ptychodera flava TaxID=63121 RepID=UPI00396A213C